MRKRITFKTLCLLGNFPCFFCRLLIFFFKINAFEKHLSDISSECQTVWIQIRPDVMSGLIWVQPVYKGYQLTTLVGKEFNTHTTSKLCVCESGMLLRVCASWQTSMSLRCSQMRYCTNVLCACSNMEILYAHDKCY